jgi:CRISPR-associated exonuclease Cas4
VRESQGRGVDEYTRATDDDWGDDAVEVPLAALEHYSYCARQCGLIHVEQTWGDNVFTVRGTIAHTRVDAGGDAPSRGVRVARAAPL